MSIEKNNPNGDRCLSYGINGNGQAECHWPECGCYPEAQQPAALAVPDGYALVPVEPTEAMLDEGGKWTDAYAVWAAMLAAAPAQQPAAAKNPKEK